MQLVVQAEGVPATAVEFEGLVHHRRWPQPGMTLPVTVDPADPQNVKIEWDEVPDSRERSRAERRGDGGRDARRGRRLRRLRRRAGDQPLRRAAERGAAGEAAHARHRPRRGRGCCGTRAGARRRTISSRGWSGSARCAPRASSPRTSSRTRSAGSCPRLSAITVTVPGGTSVSPASMHLRHALARALERGRTRRSLGATRWAGQPASAHSGSASAAITAAWATCASDLARAHRARGLST